MNQSRAKLDQSLAKWISREQKWNTLRQTQYSRGQKCVEVCVFVVWRLGVGSVELCGDVC